MGKIAAGPLAARYYTDQVALGREDYYAGEGKPPGAGQAVLLRGSGCKVALRSASSSICWAVRGCVVRLGRARWRASI